MTRCECQHEEEKHQNIPYDGWCTRCHCESFHIGPKKKYEKRKTLPDPYGQWYRYYDTTPVPYPRRCICCKRVFRNKEEENKFALQHLRDCICVTNLRTYPPYGSLDSDNWEKLE